MDSQEPEYNITRLITDRVATETYWKNPVVFDLSSKKDISTVMHLMNNDDVVKVVDGVKDIANDLFEFYNPNECNNVSKRQRFIQSLLDQKLGYGQWFYFPWSKELIRYPDKDEHRALRTSRNRELITNKEQKVLYDATITVFGLSVGSSIVEELVLSGIGGRVILGDPDYIKPSNLNRIKGNFNEIGSKKSDRVAKIISNIDPYIQQIHFEEGVNDHNIDLLTQYMPNIIFDEMDNLYSKVILRLYAQKMHIPLVMATDLGDKSIIDVERYDMGLKQIFSGRISNEEVSSILRNKLSTQETQKLMMRIVGIRQITPRFLESVMRLGRSLAGFPQLGSTATMCGALSTIAAREIILGRKLKSGRYIYSPKQTLKLQSPNTLREGIKIFFAFIQHQKTL